MTTEEKSLTREELYDAFQEYIEAEEEEKEKKQSILLLEKAFKNFDDIQESESFDVIEKRKKNKKIPSTIRFPTYNHLNKNKVLETENNLFLFIHSIVHSGGVRFLYKKKDLFKLSSPFFYKKIYKFFPFIKKKRSSLTPFQKHKFSVFFLNSLISLNIFSTYKKEKINEKNYRFIIQFSSKYGVLKKNSKDSSFSEKLLEYLHSLKSHSITNPYKKKDILTQKPYIQQELTMQKPYIQQELLINDKKEDILFSLKTFIQSFSNNSLTIRIPVKDLFNFLESVNYPIYELVLLLNKLKQQKNIFCWEYFKSNTENYYYFVFFPQKLEEICFLVKSYLEIECFENKTKQINLHSIASAFRVEISKIKECLTVLTIDNYLKVVDKDMNNFNLLTIQLL